MSRSALPPDHAQREKALDINMSTLAVAPAGSGKTSLLVARMLRCLAVSSEPEEVVAITFTRMAAAEIRARLIAALKSALGPPPDEPHEHQLHALAGQALTHANERGWMLLENPNRIRALTIDALNAELAARLPLLSGLGGPTAMTEDSHGIFDEAIKALFAELEDDSLAQEDREALHQVLRWGDNRIDVLLDPLRDMLQKREQWLKLILRQLEPGNSCDAEILGALIESRLQVMDSLLSGKDKSVLLEILREGSAHSAKLAWAASFNDWPETSAVQLTLWQHIAGTLITQKGELRKKVTVSEGFPPKLPFTARMKSWLGDTAHEGRSARLAQACADVVACPQAEYPEHLDQQRRAVARVLLRLAQHLNLVFSRHGEVDFTEVALAALRALAGEHGYSEVLDRTDTRIRHLLVDEMQDTSDAQNALLERLTSGWVPGDGHSLFMVGDPQQSIYAFRKAEVRLFLSLWEAQRLGDVPLQRITLSTNFRSTRPLIDWFNNSFSAIFPPLADVYAGTVPFNASAAPAGVASVPDPAVTVVPLVRGDEMAEAEAVAKQAKSLLPTGESIAIIARARSHLWHILAALRRHGLRYACQDIDPLQDIPGVRDYVFLARALWHPEDRLAWGVLLRSPLVGLSYADMTAMSRGSPKDSWPEKIRRSLLASSSLSDEGRARLQYLQQVLARSEADPLTHGDLPARSEAVWHALGGPACVNAEELHDVRVAMRHLRDAASSGEIDSLQALQRSLSKVYATPSAEGIQVLTAHKSKGLEFGHVLLVGCGRTTQHEDRPLLHYRRLPKGLLLVPKPPANLAEDDPANRLYDFAHSLHRQSAENELLRLLYVCCTRARKSLTLFINLDFNKEGEAVVASGSFAKLLWPVIAQACGSLVAPEKSAQEIILKLPLSPRLPQGYRFTLDDIAWRPAERRTMRPSEAALDAQETKPLDGSLHAQLVGVMYHEAMRRIASDGFEHWQDAGISRRAAMAAGFRHLGLPEPQVEAAVEQVLCLLHSTLTSEHGRWLLAPYSWARSEYALAGYRDGQWVAAIIDRCFEIDGVTWVIDYKTTGESAAAALGCHADQLRQYMTLLSAIRQQPVRGALFLAASGELVTVP